MSHIRKRAEQHTLRLISARSKWQCKSLFVQFTWIYWPGLRVWQEAFDRIVVSFSSFCGLMQCVGCGLRTPSVFYRFCTSTVYCFTLQQQQHIRISLCMNSKGRCRWTEFKTTGETKRRLHTMHIARVIVFVIARRFCFMRDFERKNSEKFINNRSNRVKFWAFNKQTLIDTRASTRYQVLYICIQKKNWHLFFSHN